MNIPTSIQKLFVREMSIPEYVISIVAWVAEHPKYEPSLPEAFLNMDAAAREMYGKSYQDLIDEIEGILEKELLPEYGIWLGDRPDDQRFIGRIGFVGISDTEAKINIWVRRGSEKYAQPALQAVFTNILKQPGRAPHIGNKRAFSCVCSRL